MIPQEVFDRLNDEYGLDEQDITINDIKPMGSLLFDKWLLLPGHHFDLSESNIQVHLENLHRVGMVALMGAPYCKIYEKADPTQPAYVFASPQWNDDGEEWSYFEWK